MRHQTLITAAIVSIASIVHGADMPAQAKRGSKLFFETTKGLPCATCHQLEGKGTPAGPDLKNIAAASPRGMVLAILATRTAYVVELETTTGRRFPAMQHSETPEGVVYYDLSASTPKTVTLKKADIRSSRDNAKWKHPPEATGYTPEELADVIAYIRFVTRGVTQPVLAADMKR